MSRIFRLFTFLFFFIICIVPTKAQDRSEEEKQFRKLGELIDMLDNYYVDSAQTSVVIEDAIQQILEELDPHSVYIPKKEVEATNEPLVGNFEGVGIQFNILNDTVVIANVISGGPSEKVGLLAGDKIIMVNDTNIAGIKIANSDVMKKLRGNKGTKVKVEVMRSGSKKLLDFVIVRDKIPLYSVDASYMVDDKIGYIRLNKFSATTTQEMRTALNDLKSKGMKDLILDLQNNGGGYLSAAVELSDEFLDDNKLIVYTEGFHQPKQVFTSTPMGAWEEGNLVVLINESSASASEIVSGAIQDWDRGLVIGRNSFGKGLVQKPFGMSDGSQVRLTVAEYFTPSGRCIQRPYDKGKKDYYSEFERRYKSGQLMFMDSIKLPDSLQYATLKNKRKVYGGGGILPDIFVGLDTSENSEYYSSLIRKGTFNQFSIKYLDQKRKELLKQFPDAKSFKNGFEVDKNLLDELVEEGVKEGTPS